MVDHGQWDEDPLTLRLNEFPTDSQGRPWRMTAVMDRRWGDPLPIAERVWAAQADGEDLERNQRTRIEAPEFVPLEEEDGPQCDRCAMPSVDCYCEDDL